MEASTHSDLAWIENNIFKRTARSRAATTARTARTPAKIDLRAGMASRPLVDVNVGRLGRRPEQSKLVVPGSPNQSYLLMMMRQHRSGEDEPPLDRIRPRTSDYMPQKPAATALLPEARRDRALDRGGRAG